MGCREGAGRLARVRLAATRHNHTGGMMQCWLVCVYLPVAVMRHRNLLISMRSVVQPEGLGGTVAPSISLTESANRITWLLS